MLTAVAEDAHYAETVASPDSGAKINQGAVIVVVDVKMCIRDRGKTTSVEATQAVLDKIAASEDTYHCYVTVEREKALQQAAEVQKKIEAGELTGPLAGVPFAIKDNMCTEGTLTTCSSKILERCV